MLAAADYATSAPRAPRGERRSASWQLGSCHQQLDPEELVGRAGISWLVEVVGVFFDEYALRWSSRTRIG